MPKTMGGRMVDESKWEEAKRLAAEEGQADNFAYITAIYKRLAHVEKSIPGILVRPSALDFFFKAIDPERIKKKIIVRRKGVNHPYPMTTYVKPEPPPEDRPSEAERAALASGIDSRATMRFGIEFGRTPKALVVAGAPPDLSLKIYSSALTKVMDDKHDLTKDQVLAVQAALYRPVAILQSATRADRFVVATDVLDNEGRPIIVAVIPGGDFYGRRMNIVASIYGRNEFSTFLERAIEERGLIYLDQKKMDGMPSDVRKQYPKALAIPSGHQYNTPDDLSKSLSEVAMLKAIDRSKLVKKPVMVKMDGKVYQSYRWVKPDNGTPKQGKPKAISEADEMEIRFYSERIEQLKEKIDEWKSKYNTEPLGYMDDLETAKKRLSELQHRETNEDEEPNGVETEDPEEFDRTASKIIDFDKYRFYGVRVCSRVPGSETQKTYKVGDVLPPSHYWEDGNPTDQELSGASAIWVTEKDKSPSAVVRDYESNGDQIVLIGSDYSRRGNDIGEIEMATPIVLAVLNKKQVKKSIDRSKLIRKPVMVNVNGKVYQSYRWVKLEEASADGGSIIRTVRSIEKLLSSYGMEFQSKGSMKSDSHYVRFKAGDGWHEIRVSDHDLPDAYLGDDGGVKGYLDIRAGEYGKAKDYIERVASSVNAKKVASSLDMAGLDEIEEMISRVNESTLSENEKIDVRGVLSNLRKMRDASRQKKKGDRDRELANRLLALSRTHESVLDVVLEYMDSLDRDSSQVKLILKGDTPEATSGSSFDYSNAIFKDILGIPNYKGVISAFGSSYGRPGTGGKFVFTSASDAPEKRWPYESKDVSSIVQEMENDGWDCKVGQDGYGAPEIKCEHRKTKEYADKLKEKRNEKWKNAKNVYIRYGNIPKNGKSKNYRDNFYEDGVSVFLGQILPSGETRVKMGTNNELGTFTTIFDRPVFVIEGEEVGTGSDGEPVVANAKQYEPKEYAKKLFAGDVKKSLTWSGFPLQGRRKIHGMDISIENRKGSVRRGVDKDGHKWKTKMHAAYGYIRGTVGKDKDHLDCYVGPDPESTRVFIIHQNDPMTGKYDEDKVMLGFGSPEEAKALYMKQYDRPGFFGSMEETDIDTFKEKALAKQNHGKKLVIPKTDRVFGVDVELVVGIQVEKEHTDDPEEARKIALDHLREDPHYYKKLLAAGLVDEPKALEVAKRLGLKKALLVLPVLEKARKSSRLVAVKKQVSRGGVSYMTTVWMLPEDAKKYAAGGKVAAQGDLFDEAPPVMQGDLFDQAPEPENPTPPKAEEKKPEASPAPAAKLIGDSFPKTVEVDGKVIGTMSESRVAGKGVVGYTISSPGWKVLARGKTPEEALAALGGGKAEKKPSEPEKKPEDGLPDPAGHKVGETIVKDGVTYRLNENHRWERVDAPAQEPKPESEAENGITKLRKFLEENGGRDKVKALLLEGRKHGDKGKAVAEALVGKMAEHTGLSQAEVLAELGIKEKTRTRTVGETKPAVDTGDDMDPNSANYRYKDTGYIAGSRKEKAAERIKALAKEGKLVRITDIDWEDLEANPRRAQEVITKSNLFGQVDWNTLKEGGMEPAAGFLIDRIYASIGKEPENNPAARRDYVNGIESIRNRLESCKTVAEVVNVIKEIGEEMKGEILSARESEEYQALYEKYSKRAAEMSRIMREKHELSTALTKLIYQKQGLEYEMKKRANRGWKPDPEHAPAIARLEKEIEAANQRHDAFKAKYPSFFDEKQREELGSDGRIWTSYRSTEEEEIHKMQSALSLIKREAARRNLDSNPVTRAWLSLGPKFSNVINYRSYRGSDAFGDHVATAKAGRIKDWSWAEKERIQVKKTAKRSIDFQLRVAEAFERKGGRDLGVNSTMALKEAFGLRDVQSGNWVLKDVNSAKFHVESSAAALADLSDILGVPDDKISLNGRLALAFGARGSGASGFAGGAPRAHYERVERVINITKMGGGGCLAHEWFHAFDNMIAEAAGLDTAAEKDFMSTEAIDRLSANPELQDAVRGLVKAMREGSVRQKKTFSYTASDLQTAKYNLGGYYTGGIKKKIRDAGSAQAAIQAIEADYAGMKDNKKAMKQRDRWITLAAAWYGGKAEGGEVSVEAGPPVSSFLAEASILDTDRSKSYWSTTREMGARAFQAWCEDRLADQGRKSDYLSVYADNEYYKDPMFGDTKPFPEGEERKKINAAFDRLFEVVRKGNLIQKAIEAEQARMQKAVTLWSLI